jgi:hypothetical protein
MAAHQGLSPMTLLLDASCAGQAIEHADARIDVTVRANACLRRRAYQT